jgi:hypothetical protein
MTNDLVETLCALQHSELYGDTFKGALAIIAQQAEEMEVLSEMLKGMNEQLEEMYDKLPIWQPIETVDKSFEEENILLLLQNGHVHQGWYSRLDQEYQYIEHPKLYAYEPTHWMPLPKEPEE